ncbi:MAG: amidohydrolase family protein [Nitrososphaerales archaeon]
MNRWAMWMKIMTPVAQENLRMLVGAGAIVATGTDLFFGPDYHRELELLQSAGIPPVEILISATINSAIYLSKESEIGSVEPKKTADLIVVRRDPTIDVSKLKEIVLVLKSSSVIDLSKLDLPVNKF